jgi:hypothetical protein
LIVPDQPEKSLRTRVVEGGVDPDAVRDLVTDLSRSDTRFHGWAEDVAVNWQLSPDALALITEVVRPGHRTLETGVGYSTIAFAALGARHTAVSPFALEHDRLRAWCDEHGLDHTGVTFVAAPSQDALPAMDRTPLDVVLIDGDHAFPGPYIDFYYAGGRLVPGGILIVDDTHLRACRVLDDFLRADTPRWRLHKQLGPTSAFERLEGPLIPDESWAHQPWGAKILPVRGARLHQVKRRVPEAVKAPLRSALARLPPSR